MYKFFVREKNIWPTGDASSNLFKKKTREDDTIQVFFINIYSS